jgi:hypothetical protein
VNTFSLKNLTEICEEDELDVRGGTSLFYDDFSSIAISSPRSLFLFPARKSQGTQFQVTTNQTSDSISVSAVVQSS